MKRFLLDTVESRSDFLSTKRGERTANGWKIRQNLWKTPARAEYETKKHRSTGHEQSRNRQVSSFWVRFREEFANELRKTCEDVRGRRVVEERRCWRKRKREKKQQKWKKSRKELRASPLRRANAGEAKIMAPSLSKQEPVVFGPSEVELNSGAARRHRWLQDSWLVGGHQCADHVRQSSFSRAIRRLISNAYRDIRLAARLAEQ